MPKILIKNGKIWDGDKFFYADILSNDNKIIRIEKSISENADFVYNAKNKIVSAGLVDAHTHIKGISPDSIGMNSEMGCLPFGVTATADAMGIQNDNAFLDSLLVKTRVFVCADIKNNSADFKNAKDMLKKYKNRAVGIKIFFDKKSSDVRDISPLEETVRFAEENALIVMVHSSNSPVSMAELIKTLRKGDILTHAYHGGENNASEDGYNCITEAKKRGVIIDAGIEGRVHTDYSIFKDALRCGATPDIISTDLTKHSAYTLGGRYGLTMCMSIARHFGMEETDIFRAVTSIPAKALGTEDTWGTLAPGKTGDIAVLEYTDEGFDITDSAGNNVYCTKGYRNILTVVNGEIVYRR